MTSRRTDIPTVPVYAPGETGAESRRGLCANRNVASEAAGDVPQEEGIHGARLIFGAYLILLTLVAMLVGAAIMVYASLGSTPPVTRSYVSPIFLVAVNVFCGAVPPGLLGVYLLTCREPALYEDFFDRLVRLGARIAAVATAAAVLFIGVQSGSLGPVLFRTATGVLTALFVLVALLMCLHLSRIASHISRDALRSDGVLGAFMLCASAPAFLVLWALFPLWLSVLGVVIAQCLVLHALFMWQLRRWRLGAASGSADTPGAPAPASPAGAPLRDGARA